jgi:hypothetical protein
MFLSQMVTSIFGELRERPSERWMPPSIRARRSPTQLAVPVDPVPFDLPSRIAPSSRQPRWAGPLTCSRAINSTSGRCLGNRSRVC